MRQEIVAHLTTHVGSGTTEEVDCAMAVIQEFTLKGAALLKPFSAFITSMLDSLQNMTLAQIRRLFIILFTLADESDGDDVHIVIRKNLSHSNIRMKRIGIVGVTAFAVCKSLKLRKDNLQMATIMSLQAGEVFPAERLEFRSSGQSSQPQDSAAGPLNPATSGEDVIKILSDIKAMLQLAHENCDPGTNRNMFLSSEAQSPLGYLFDEFALAIRGNQMAPVVKEWILSKYQVMLEEVFMCDFEEREEQKEGAAPTPALKPVDPGDLGLLTISETLPHRQTPYAEMRYNEDGDESDFYVRIIPFAISKDPAMVSKLSLIVPLLRLLSACHDPRYGGSGLTEIDAVIGAPLMLMETEQAGMNYQQLPEETKRAGVMSTYHAVNWVRELLNR